MMAGSVNLAWLYEAIGWCLAAVGAVTLLWALYWDRARGRQRCPSCWYDLGSLPTLKCPECGREARSRKATLRTRRRWRWVTVGLLLCAGGYLTYHAPRMARGVARRRPDDGAHLVGWQVRTSRGVRRGEDVAAINGGEGAGAAVRSFGVEGLAVAVSGETTEPDPLAPAVAGRRTVADLGR